MAVKLPTVLVETVDGAFRVVSQMKFPTSVSVQKTSETSVANAELLAAMSVLVAV